MDQYSTSLIVVGDETLNRHIIDINTSYLAESLRTAGLNLQRIMLVPNVVCIILFSQNVR